MESFVSLSALMREPSESEEPTIVSVLSALMLTSLMPEPIVRSLPPKDLSISAVVVLPSFLRSIDTSA